MNEIQRHYRLAKLLAWIMDSRFSIFGIKFGLDPLLGLIPGIGDLATLAISFYPLWIASKAGLPSSIIGRMFGNVAADFAISIVPIVGSAADFFFRSFNRNMKILDSYLEQTPILDGEVVANNRSSG